MRKFFVRLRPVHVENALRGKPPVAVLALERPLIGVLGPHVVAELVLGAEPRAAADVAVEGCC
jgi:hypothetical protein